MRELSRFIKAIRFSTRLPRWFGYTLFTFGAALPLNVQAVVWEDGGGNNNWANDDNWENGGPHPDGTGAVATFGNTPTGSGLQSVVLNKTIIVGTLIFEGTQHNYQLSSNNNNRRFAFDQFGSADANLIVSGDQEHIIGSTGTRLSIGLLDNLVIDNNSTATTGLTIGFLNDDHDLQLRGNGLIVTGNGQTIINSRIVDESGTGSNSVIKNGSGTLGLTGGNSTFSGGLTIDDGTVNATRNGAITLGTENGPNNIAGSGAITVNGGTFNLTQTGNAIITLRGAPLTNNGGVININSIGNNDSRDFDIGLNNNSSPGQFISTGGITNISVGDDFSLWRNSSINVSGGTVNFTANDAFRTRGTSGNPATIEVTGTGTLNVDVTGPSSSDDFQILVGQHDVMTVDGPDAAATFVADAISPINLFGRINLTNSGTLTVEPGAASTTISDTATIDGGDPGTAGTLEMQMGLFIDSDATISNAPNLTFNTADNVSLSGTTTGTTTTGWGTLTQAGSGTTTIDSSINEITADTIVINDGTLLLGSNNQIGNSTDMVLAGGTFNTNNFDDVLGTLTLTANSIIDFGDTPGDGSILRFADSSGEDWTFGATLTIINWEGIVGTGNGIDQLFFGSNDSGLSAQQRSQIVFADFPGDETIQLADGEVVPVPEPAAIAATLGLAALIGWRERRRIISISKKMQRLSKAVLPD